MHRRVMTGRRFLLLITGCGCCFVISSVNADFLPWRICRIRTFRNLDQSWKFFRGDPAGASAASFDDASWQTVNLPHSAQYDAPTPEAEQSSVPQSGGWNGVHWYRKSFSVPSSAHNQRVFVQFDGAMQIAEEMGANAVRCSHYPRAPAFYHACDELGVLCLPELPSWGCCGNAPYPSDFWDRMNTAAQEMVEAGYNHPSIIAWGIFNEPRDNYQTQFSRLNATLHGIDSTRPTAVYGSSSQLTYPGADLCGMNYEIYPNVNIRTRVTGSFVSEYHEGWLKWCYRGDTSTANDASLSGSLSENRFAADRWSGSNNWTQILAAWNGSTQPVPGGGFRAGFCGAAGSGSGR
ncbi:MAG: hypothetical protein JXA18_12080 [Chitinispirillaceae bacterium]|nr:hypothetical protein [Chitinispirillaceae bacterium]